MTSGFTDEELRLEVSGESRPALVRTPARLCGRPALLISLMGDRRASLDDPAYRLPPDVFLAAGHRVASFDLPQHGERANRRGSGLAGMAAAIAAGVDVFADIQATGRALVAECIRRGLARAVALNGVSRGGLAALHVMAADPRVLACAIHAPVTWLPALSEFQALADNPIVQRANALALAERLAGRAVFIAIGAEDRRVGAEHCFAFHERLRAAAPGANTELFCIAGASHTREFPEDIGFQAGAAFLLRCVAQETKDHACRDSAIGIV